LPSLAVWPCRTCLLLPNLPGIYQTRPSQAGLETAATLGPMAAAGSLQKTTPAAPVREGIYEFPDKTAGGLPYVGQSGNIPNRLGQHEVAGRLEPGTETSTPVSGGKTAREIAEHNRIQELTGGQRARNSPNVANENDPIGPNRRPGLGLPEPRE